MIHTKKAKGTKGTKDEDRAQRIATLTQELENLQRSIPAHSIKPAMLIHMEELEEQIEALQDLRGFSKTSEV
jgi:polyhydroxyalkanoate synthesis regulator phasin